MSETNNEGGGDSGQTWVDTVPEADLRSALRDAPFIKGSKDIESWKSEVKGVSDSLGNSIRLPSAEAGEEDVGKFQRKVLERAPGMIMVPPEDDDEAMGMVLNKLGRPSDPENYTLPEGVELDADTLGREKARAHALGMTQKAFAKDIAERQGALAEERQRREDHFKEQHSLLKTEWGQAYDDRVGEINAFLANNEDTPDAFKQAFEKGEFSAADARWLHGLAQLGEEGATVNQQSDGGDRKMTPAEAEAQLSEIENRLFKENGGRPMHPSHPDFQRLSKRKIELLRMMQT